MPRSKPPRTNIDKCQHIPLPPNAAEAWCKCGMRWWPDRGWHKIEASDWTTYEETYTKAEVLTYIKELTKDPAVIKRAEEDLR